MNAAAAPAVRSASGVDPRVGVVAIGRNEGERLRRCLASVLTQAKTVVYVDSGSTDGSAVLAAELGATVHPLDLTRPFTAARARNEGAALLATLAPSAELIQFVDGDCEVVDGWVRQGVAFLDAHPVVAAVCGRRREREPQRSVYNRLCDLEWNTPVGEAKACGGDVLMRAAAFRQSGGYREDLVAGEEPELCVRLRAAGWRIWRLDAEMTLHDAAMTRVGQWWRRCVRAGFAFAEGARLHGAPPERHWVRESRSALLWGAGLPLAIVMAAGLAGPLALLAFVIYPVQVARLAMRGAGRASTRWTRSFFLVAGKFPEAQGQLRSWRQRVRRQPRAELIEYK